MKIVIAVIITALITSAGAYGATSWNHVQNGIWCKTSGVNTLCIPTSGRGYGVAISRNAAMLYDINRDLALPALPTVNGGLTKRW